MCSLWKAICPEVSLDLLIVMMRGDKEGENRRSAQKEVMLASCGTKKWFQLEIQGKWSLPRHSHTTELTKCQGFAKQDGNVPELSLVSSHNGIDSCTGNIADHVS